MNVLVKFWMRKFQGQDSAADIQDEEDSGNESIANIQDEERKEE